MKGLHAHLVSKRKLEMLLWGDRLLDARALGYSRDEAAANGTHRAIDLIPPRKAGENPLEYLLVTLENLMVTNVSTGGAGGEDRLTENVTLNFAKVKVQYKEQTEKGAVGDKPEMGWDVAQNAKQ